LGLELGLGIMVWSPLASGLLSSKYRAESRGMEKGDSILLKTAKIQLQKVTRAELENRWRNRVIAKELGHSMAQVAVNWTANRPGVGL